MQEYNPYEREGVYVEFSNGSQTDERQSLGKLSLILGAMALCFFYSGFNLFFALLAIIFGIIQLFRPRKALAVAGLATAILSVTLFFGSYMYMLSNEAFVDMMYEEYVLPMLGEDAQSLLYEEYL